MAMKLSQAAIEARRKYQREYYARNRERMQARQAAYWERLAEKGDSERQKTAENGRKQGKG